MSNRSRRGAEFSSRIKQEERRRWYKKNPGRRNVVFGNESTQIARAVQMEDERRLFWN